MGRTIITLSIVGLCLGTPTMAGAQSKPHSVEGTPLDTIMSTRLWTSVAPAQDFVTQTRPDPETLNYAPLIGTDPKRIPPRNKANIQALKQELEQDLSANSSRLKPHGAKVRAKVQPKKL